MAEQFISVRVADDGQSVKSLHNRLARCNSRELMDALIAADLPLGGTDEQRRERLLSAVQPQDVWQFLPRDASAFLPSQSSGHVG
jgi:hypothetical protein